MRADRSIPYTIFMIVLMMYSPSLRANYLNFDGSEQHFVKNPTPVNESLLSCVKDVCSGFDPKKTYQTYFSEVAMSSEKSDFFDRVVLPQVKKSYSNSLTRQLEAYLIVINYLKAAKAPRKLSEPHRYAMAFFKVALSITKSIPVGVPVVTDKTADTTHYFAYRKPMTEEDFNREKANGHFEHLTFKMVNKYELEENFGVYAPFTGFTGNLLAHFSANSGRSATQQMANAYDLALKYFLSLNGKNEHIKFAMPIASFIARRNFIVNNFELGTKLTSISNFSDDFVGPIFLSQLMQIHQILGDLIDPDELGIPKELSLDYINSVSGNLQELEKVLKKQRAPENRKLYLNHITEKCRWKINFLYSGLPTDNEIQKKRRVIAKAIVTFQDWLFKNASEETATVLFDFLRGWHFFLPPSKSEFKKFINEFIPLDRNGLMGPLLFDPLLLPEMLETLSKSSLTESSEFARFCKDLRVSPLGDRANSQSGHVTLSWMSLKDERLLKSVVWHELAHVVSALMKGEQRFDYYRQVLKSAFLENVSLESFTQYNKTLQCLGSNQKQKSTGLGPLTTEHADWVKKGLLPEFEHGIKYKSKGQVLYDSLDLSETGTILTLDEENAGEDGLHTFDSRTKAYLQDVYPSGIAALITGNYVEEDWADLISASIGKNTENHFCFVVKGQESLLEKKNSNMTKKEDDKDATERHSSLLYRLLHTEIIRSGYLPASCQRVVKEHPEYSNIKRCDYF